jgi:hypothetical protein
MHATCPAHLILLDLITLSYYKIKLVSMLLFLFVIFPPPIERFADKMCSFEIFVAYLC